MALLMCENFATVVDADLDIKYGVVGTPTIQTFNDNRTTTTVMKVDDDEGIQWIAPNIIESADGIVVGMAIYAPTNHSNYEILSIRDESGNEQVGVRVNAGRRFTVIRAGGAGTTIGIGDTPFFFEKWYYVEFKLTVSNTVGSFELRVNGRIEDSDNNIDTQGAASSNIGSVFFEKNLGSAVSDLYYTDLYVCDQLGGVNNDFLGDIHVETIRPDADGTTNNWVPLNAGDNYVEVDETNQDGDTTYNTGSNAADLDLYGYAAIADSPNSIKGLQINSVIRREDGSTREVRDAIRSGAANYLGQGSVANTNPGNSYTNYATCHDTNPDTAVAWTEAGINAAEFGIDLES
jgi:predicted RecA/RadA family phage recombinase